MPNLIEPYEAKSLEVGSLEQIEGSYKIPIKYTDIHGNQVSQTFLTEVPDIETAILKLKKKVLVIHTSPNGILVGKLNGVGGIIIDNKDQQLEEGKSFMVGIGKGNFNPEGQYWVKLGSLADREATYIFTTNDRQNKNPFPGKLSSTIAILNKREALNQYNVSIKGIDTAGNDCDIHGVLVVKTQD